MTASYDKTARVWNADGHGEPLVLLDHEDWVTAAAFSPDGRRVVTASDDKTARVWNADGQGEPLVLRGHESRVTAAAFNPDGRRVVTASWDTTARVWHADIAGLQQTLREASVDCLDPTQRATYLSENADETRRGYETCERAHGRTPFFEVTAPP